jgi:DNA replication and repair protein RecF
MALLSLQLSQFRNMTALSLTAHAEFNVIYGENGSGKTSLLEAIYYLAHGRSFRSRAHQRLIKDDADHFTLHAKISNNQQQYSLGLQRNRSAELLLRLNGANVQRLAEFASLLPVQLVTPDSFRLFFGGPKERRQFFDMGVFHVEPTFFPVWLQFSRVLKQRNALLKQRRRYDDEFAYWDQQFANQAWQLQSLRQQYINQLNDAYTILIAANPMLQDVTLQLQSGWPERITSEQALLDLLKQNFEQDCRQGFSQYGPQKADLKLKKAHLAVEEVLSRGQLKVLLFALKIAQNNVISNSGSKQPLLLIDDLASELDSSSTQLVFDYLTQINSQVFITAINADQVSPFIAASSSKMFHVEQGQITARTDDDGRTT